MREIEVDYVVYKGLNSLILCKGFLPYRRFGYMKNGVLYNDTKTPVKVKEGEFEIKEIPLPLLEELEFSKVDLRKLKEKFQLLFIGFLLGLLSILTLMGVSGLLK